MAEPDSVDMEEFMRQPDSVMSVRVYGGGVGEDRTVSGMD